MSKQRKSIPPLFALLITIAFAAIDQLIKWVVELNIKPVKMIPILKFGETEWINLTYCENTGMSFSMFEGNKLLLIIFPCVIIAIAEWYIFSGRIKSNAQLLTLAVALGGGIGNLLDRFIRGYVVDFIDFRIINFAIFNFADICIVCGGIIFVILYAIDDYKDSKREKNEQF